MKVEMRNLVLGIIAVICVQFAFVNYMELQAPLDVAVAPVFSEPTPPAHVDLAWIEELNMSARAPVEKESIALNETRRSIDSDRILEPRFNGDPERPATLRAARPRLSPPAKTPAERFPDHSRTAPAGGFETVVISYNRAPENPICTTYDPPKTRKRSYIARAAPIVKKPWEWMKAVGSKLY